MAESHRDEIAKLEALYAGNPGGRVFVHLAEAYRKAGEHERARRILDEGLARHTDSASGYVVLGRVLADMQISDEAEVAFRRVLDLDSGNLVALRWLGDLARQSGRVEEAIGHYRELLIRNPSNEEVREIVEIVERESSGTRLAPPEEPEWHEPEPVEQVPEVPHDSLTPLSAAPGRTGDEEPAEVEFGMVEIQGLEDVSGHEPITVQGDVSSQADERTREDAGPAHDHAAPSHDAAGQTGDSPVIESLSYEMNEAADDLGGLSRTDEAEPLEIHLLDPSFGGGEESDEEEYAGDEFLADLVSGVPEPEEPDALDASVDVLGAGSGLTLQDAPVGDTSAAADHPTRDGAPSDWASDISAEHEPPPLRPHGDEVGAAALESHRDAEDTAGFHVEESALESGEVASGDADADAERAEPAPFFSTTDRLRDRMDAFAAEFADEPEPGFHAEPDSEARFETASEAADAAALESQAETNDEPQYEVPGPLRDAGEERPGATEPETAGAIAESGLVTETMAELYRAQGFHDRAADVYRALLRQRPFDLRLSARLSEAEADAAAAAAERAASTPPAPEDQASADVWLRGVGAPWDAGAAEAPDGATMYTWTPEPEDQPGGEPISAYLKDLVSWRIAGQGWSERKPATPPEPRQQQTPWSPDDEPWAASPAGEQWGTTEAATNVDPWGSPAPESESPLGEPAGSQSGGAAASPEQADAHSPQVPSGSEPADPWLRGTVEPTDPWAAAASSVEDRETSGWGSSEPAAESQIQPQEQESDTDDEDLEMFRSWLQSLKK